MTLITTEPCTLCGKVPRGDIFGLCLDCGDLEHVSEFFLTTDPEGYNLRVDSLIHKGYVKREDYTKWRTEHDAKIAKATPDQLAMIESIRKIMTENISKDGDFYKWKCPNCDAKIRTRNRKAIDEITAEHIVLHDEEKKQ